MKTRVRTLKEVANTLKVSMPELQRLRTKLNNKHDNTPEFMIHGTNGYKWNLDAFKSIM